MEHMGELIHKKVNPLDFHSKRALVRQKLARDFYGR